MPTEKWVEESHKYWCPKWYAPWRTCTRRSRVHYWCYQFRWIDETGYVFVSRLKGCEGGKAYAWWEPSFMVFGTKRYYQHEFGEKCFTSPRGSDGTCAL